MKNPAPGGTAGAGQEAKTKIDDAGDSSEPRSLLQTAPDDPEYSSAPDRWKKFSDCAASVVERLRHQRDGLADPEAEISTLGDASLAFAKLRASGVSDRILFTSEGIFGAATFAPIRAEPGGLFSFDEGGVLAIVLVALNEWHEIADLVAWAPDRPDVWRRRTGAVKFLGEYAVREAAFFRRPIQLFESPLSWLRASCVGTVVLDPKADIRPDLDGITSIICETDALATRIARQLRDWANYCPVRVTVAKRVGIAA